MANFDINFPYKKATAKTTGGLDSFDGFILAKRKNPGMQKSNDTNISSIWGGRERVLGRSSWIANPW